MDAVCNCPNFLQNSLKSLLSWCISFLQPLIYLTLTHTSHWLLQILILTEGFDFPLCSPGSRCQSLDWMSLYLFVLSILIACFSARLCFPCSSVCLPMFRLSSFKLFSTGTNVETWCHKNNFLKPLKSIWWLFVACKIHLLVVPSERQRSLAQAYFYLWLPTHSQIHKSYFQFTCDFFSRHVFIFILVFCF